MVALAELYFEFDTIHPFSSKTSDIFETKVLPHSWPLLLFNISYNSPPHAWNDIKAFCFACILIIIEYQS